MTQTTLCLLIKDNQILLALKKRGFGVGRWNGYGGKLRDRETVEQAAIRETNEEIGVSCAESDLQKVALIHFSFALRSEWEQQVHVFLIRNWQGQPSESEEMRPQWFDFDKIPYDQMWPDDSYWLPKVLAGKKLDADFRFNDEGNNLERIEIKEI